MSLVIWNQRALDSCCKIALLDYSPKAVLGSCTVHQHPRRVSPMFSICCCCCLLCVPAFRCVECRQYLNITRERHKYNYTGFLKEPRMSRLNQALTKFSCSACPYLWQFSKYAAAPYPQKSLNACLEVVVPTAIMSLALEICRLSFYNDWLSQFISLTTVHLINMVHQAWNVLILYWRDYLTPTVTVRPSLTLCQLQKAYITLHIDNSIHLLESVLPKTQLVYQIKVHQESSDVLGSSKWQRRILQHVHKNYTNLTLTVPLSHLYQLKQFSKADNHCLTDSSSRAPRLCTAIDCISRKKLAKAFWLWMMHDFLSEKYYLRSRPQKGDKSSGNTPKDTFKCDAEPRYTETLVHEITC